MQNLIEIYHVIQELWAFLLSDNDRPDWCSAKPCPSKKDCYAYQCLDNVDIHTYVKFDQNIPCASRVMSIPINCNLDGRTDSHSDYSAQIILQLKPVLGGVRIVALSITSHEQTK